MNLIYTARVDGLSVYLVSPTGTETYLAERTGFDEHRLTYCFKPKHNGYCPFLAQFATTEEAKYIAEAVFAESHPYDKLEWVRVNIYSLHPYGRFTTVRRNKDGKHCATASAAVWREVPDLAYRFSTAEDARTAVSQQDKAATFLN